MNGDLCATKDDTNHGFFEGEGSPNRMCLSGVRQSTRCYFRSNRKHAGKTRGTLFLVALRATEVIGTSVYYLCVSVEPRVPGGNLQDKTDVQSITHSVMLFDVLCVVQRSVCDH